jgi:hypothetical protein
LPQKPLKGGSPASAMAGMKKPTATHGCVFAIPRTRPSVPEPPTRSAMPPAKKSAVFTMMWCTM